MAILKASGDYGKGRVTSMRSCAPNGGGMEFSFRGYFGVVSTSAISGVGTQEGGTGCGAYLTFQTVLGGPLTCAAARGGGLQTHRLAEDGSGAVRIPWAYRGRGAGAWMGASHVDESFT